MEERYCLQMVACNDSCGNVDGEVAVPFIGENGNWRVGNEDTKIAAQGPKGDMGDCAELLPFKKLYLIDGTVSDRSKILPFPDELCNSDNLLPVSLMVKSLDGIGYFNNANEDAYIWFLKSNTHYYFLV